MQVLKNAPAANTEHFDRSISFPIFSGECLSSIICARKCDFSFQISSIRLVRRFEDGSYHR